MRSNDERKENFRKTFPRSMYLDGLITGGDRSVATSSAIRGALENKHSREISRVTTTEIKVFFRPKNTSLPGLSNVNSFFYSNTQTSSMRDNDARKNVNSYLRPSSLSSKNIYIDIYYSRFA